MLLVNGEQMRTLEAEAINEYKMPSVILMENAAQGFFRRLRGEWGEVSGKRLCVVCGGGNNGGDGFAIARLAQNAGAEVSVALLCGEEKIKGDAEINYKIIKKMGIAVTTDLPDRPDIIVDAIFGTGFHGEVKEHERGFIEKINAAGAFVAAVDIPSGAFAADGQIGGCCVRADMTVAFGEAKVGLYLYPAKAYCGKIFVEKISVPQQLISGFDSGTYLLDSSAVNIPPRDDSGHKGSFGRVSCVCGSRGMTGACFMSATAALKSGAGLVTAAVGSDIADIMAVKFTEVMLRVLPETPADAYKELCGLASDVILVGCGIGRGEPAASLARLLISRAEQPVVIDADGINAICGNINILSERSAPCVITPHLAEFARLLGKDVGEVMKNRMALGREFSEKYNAVLVLKSADTLIFEPGGRMYVCGASNSGMATAGSGDVLAGTVAGLIAQGADCASAARAGVYIHSRAGELAARLFGEYGMTAGNILENLPAAIKSIKQE